MPKNLEKMFVRVHRQTYSNGAFPSVLLLRLGGCGFQYKDPERIVTALGDNR
jgi:hypothetical protein